jgi:hypothetical protein
MAMQKSKTMRQNIHRRLARCAAKARQIIVSGFPKAVTSYVRVMPLFVVLAVTQAYGSRDLTGTILNNLPLMWIFMIGGHCLLFLLLERPAEPAPISAMNDALPQETITTYALDSQTMARVFRGVLNKNVVETLTGLPGLALLPPGAKLSTPFQSFAFLKFPAVAVFVEEDIALPIAIDADASILWELTALVPGLSRDEADRLYDLALRQPTFCRFYLRDSEAAHWPLPLNPDPRLFVSVLGVRQGS